MNQQELQRILLMPEGLRAQYLAALKKPQKMSGGGEFGRKAQRINQATSFGDVPMGNQIVKDVGGNWLGGDVENALQPLTRKPRVAGINEHTDEHTARDVATNNWVKGNLTNYVKKQMATEADPVRKLAEQGISHFPIAEDPTYWARKGELSRKEAGGNLMSKSDLARQWENRSDAAINAETAQQHQDMMHLAPGMYTSAEDWIKKLPPETTLYNTGVKNLNPSDLGFDHIMDVLREDLVAGRIRPEQLSKISMEQAVRRVHEYDQDKLKKMRETAIKNTEGMPVHKVYDNGHKWIELAMPKGEAALSDLGKQIMAKHKAEGTEPSPGVLEQAIKQGGEEKLSDALKYEGDTMGHCVGGYCPDVIEGRSRIFSLRDAKGEPHVTIETEPSPFHPIGTNTKGTEFPSEITYGNNAVPISIPKEQKQAIYNLAKKLFAQQGGQPHARLQEAADAIIGKAPDRISQIKGKGNAKPVAKYIPMVQDFVKSHNWGGVEDLHHTDLIHLDANSDLAQAIQATGEKPPQYITQQELTDLSKKHNFPTWVNNVQKKADGGSVEKKEPNKLTHDNVMHAMHCAKSMQNYTNCKLAAQLASGVSKIENLPKVKKANIGDIHAFGIHHYAIDVGNGHVVDVPEWGGDVERKPLKEVTDEYGEPTAIHRPPQGAYLHHKAVGGAVHMSEGGELPKLDPRQNMINDVYSKYPVHPFNSNQRLMVEGEGENQTLGTFELKPSMSARDAVELNWLSAYPHKQGVGSRTLQKLQEHATEHNVGLTLFPWKHGRVSQSKLIKFYKKHGFDSTIKGSKNMIWRPENKAKGGAIHMNKGGSDHAFVKHKHGEKVGGYHVGEKINNYGSYESSGISKVLPGIHKVPMSSFETTHPNDLFYAKNDHDRMRHLAEQIKHNQYLDPLLVAMDEKGPYVLEGGHRLGAAHLLGMKEIPAMVGYEPEVEHLAPKAQGGSIKPVGYTKEKVTVSPSLDRMQYELMSVKHFKKAK